MGYFPRGNIGKLIPPLVGLAEVAEILGWDRRKVATYIKRGNLPEPIQRLRSGPIWTRKQIEEYQRRLQNRIFVPKCR